MTKPTKKISPLKISVSETNLNSEEFQQITQETKERRIHNWVEQTSSQANHLKYKTKQKESFIERIKEDNSGNKELEFVCAMGKGRFYLNDQSFILHLFKPVSEKIKSLLDSGGLGFNFLLRELEDFDFSRAKLPELIKDNNLPDQEILKNSFEIVDSDEMTNVIEEIQKYLEKIKDNKDKNTTSNVIPSTSLNAGSVINAVKDEDNSKLGNCCNVM